MRRPRLLLSTVLLSLFAWTGPGPAALAQQSSPVPKNCQLTISGNDAIQYDKKTMKADPKCKEIEVILIHVGKLPIQAMGHNWVLARTADIEGIVADGAKAGLENNYVKPGDERVIAATKVIGGGEKTSVRFPVSALKQGESYTYVCTFPGHSALMRGTFTLG